MKELSIEEKAKSYDRALEIAKAWYKLDNNDLSNDDLKTLFPELKKSEDDEKIWKEFCEDIWNYIPYEKAHKYIAWLKSLKERYAWRPSDEQMRVLKTFTGTIPPYEPMLQILKSLYNELKKLKED